MDEEIHRKEVVRRIQRALTEGSKTYFEVLPRTDGSDPRLVRRLFDEIIGEQPEGSSTGLAFTVSAIRSKLLENLPAEDPAMGQWWYTPDTQEQLANRILELCPPQTEGTPPSRVLAIGAPTLAPLLTKMRCEVTIVDYDEEVLDALTKICQVKNSIQFDVMAGEPVLPERVHVAIVDPPWYPDETDAFIRTAIGNLDPGGHLFVTMPPLLTRPSIQKERNELLQQLQNRGMEVLFLDRNILRYTVPRFEESAFKNVEGFCAYPWRVADLLVCQKLRNTELSDSHKKQTQKTALTTQRFSREPKEFRVFVGGADCDLPERVIVSPLEGFSENVSRRSHDNLYPNVWTSEKVGVRVSSIDEALLLLNCWEKGKTLEQTAGILEGKFEKVDSDTSWEIVRKFDEHLGLWSRFQHESMRREPKQIEQSKKKVRSPWSTESSSREHALEDDRFRPEYSRDRDRILWSGSFRKLAGKTQLFPASEGDQLRQRLAHSIEVMQLASTISESFGLDSELVEAGALAHDIGHTPFGHAGEFALDKLLTQLSPKSKKTAHGFNHYEHGVDVVRYLEGPYHQNQHLQYEGLNLTPEVTECIFKHTYCQSGGTRISHDKLRERSKHRNFLLDGFCHIEGQAVRIADKISYLISDIEDGIRLNVVDDSSLMSCRLFHRAPIDMSQPSGEPLHRRFLMQRRNIIKVLMEDVINETGRRMARVSDPKGVRTHSEYLVNHSIELDSDVKEIWRVLQSSLLHRDTRVVRANLQAAKIVGELTLLFSVFPQCVGDCFAQEHKRLWDGTYLKHYKDEFGTDVQIQHHLISFLPLDRYIGGETADDERRVAVEELIMAKDYVASLTDEQAKVLYRDFLSQ